MVFLAGILTISDTASLDPTADKSGPIIAQILAENRIDCSVKQIVPDNLELIRQTVRSWAARRDVDWIITTGGTGFGVRDQTPEAVHPLIDREAPGLVHFILSKSLGYTPLAALSRPVAGTIGDTLVVTLPGSSKAVKECLEALFEAGLVSHALELIKGGSGKGVHAALASSSGNVVAPGSHAHSHSHHSTHSHHAPKPRTALSNDPSLPVTARQRVSPFPLLSYHEAVKAILRQVPLLDVVTQSVTPALKNYVLAEDVTAPHNVPPAPTTNVDGYALRSTDAAGVYNVLTPRTMSKMASVPEGHVYRINTGAPLPAGTDSVIMVEDTQLVSTTAGIRTSVTESEILPEEEKEIRTLAQVSPGENVRSAGSDVKRGDLVLSKGEILQGGGGEIGTLVFVGRKQATVYRRPVVAIVSTGNELVDSQYSPNNSAAGHDGWSGIWDTNRPSLQALLESLGYDVVDLGIIADDLTAHVRTLRSGLERADVVIATGGTSMGASDLIKPVIERSLGGTIHFGRVAIKPGKPTTFATIPMQDGKVKPIFALPGNPASALVTFYIFVVPALRKMGGWPESRCQAPRVTVQLMQSMKLDSRAEFHRVIVKSEGAGLKAYSTGGQRSSRVASLSGANGLVILPPKTDNAPDEMRAGESAQAILIGEIQGGY